jgi:hypothetical protein
MHGNATEAEDSPFEGLAPNKVKALEALSRGENRKAAGVDPATLWRWCHKDAQFSALLNQLVADQLEELRQELSALTFEAIRTLRDLMRDEKVSPALKLRAAGLALRRLAPMPAPPVGNTDQDDAVSHILAQIGGL